MLKKQIDLLQEIFQDADVMYGENIPSPPSSLSSPFAAASLA